MKKNNNTYFNLDLKSHEQHPFHLKIIWNDNENFTLVLSYKDKQLFLKASRNKNYFININKACKFMNKRWRSWLRSNKSLVNKLEQIEDKKLMRIEIEKNIKQTFIDLRLALLVLNSYEPITVWNILNGFLKEFYDQKNSIDLLQKKITNPKKIPLDGGESLFYAYLCNNRIKFGSSYCNRKGERIKSHIGSVPRLEIGFIFYSNKKHIQALNTAIKLRFKSTLSYEHVQCSMEELENFVINYFTIMKFDFKKESIHKIKLLNILLNK